MRVILRLWICVLLASVGFAPTALHAQTYPGLGSTPVAIDIPTIGTHAQVVPLGHDDNGTMQSPTDPDTVGWYQPGVGVGAPGNALLDGHVDWGGRLRVFGYLKQLAPGDIIQITDAAGNVFNYNVAWTRLYEAETAPLADVFEQTGADEITLITCGGAFDQSIRMYLSRWVVRATRVPEPISISAS